MKPDVVTIYVQMASGTQHQSANLRVVWSIRNSFVWGLYKRTVLFSLIGSWVPSQNAAPDRIVKSCHQIYLIPKNSETYNGFYLLWLYWNSSSDSGLSVMHCEPVIAPLASFPWKLWSRSTKLYLAMWFLLVFIAELILYRLMKRQFSLPGDGNCWIGSTWNWSLLTELPPKCLQSTNQQGRKHYRRIRDEIRHSHTSCNQPMSSAACFTEIILTKCSPEFYVSTHK